MDLMLPRTNDNAMKKIPARVAVLVHVGISISALATVTASTVIAVGHRDAVPRIVMLVGVKAALMATLRDHGKVSIRCRDSSGTTALRDRYRWRCSWQTSGSGAGITEHGSLLCDAGSVDGGRSRRVDIVNTGVRSGQLAGIAEGAVTSGRAAAVSTSVGTTSMRCTAWPPRLYCCWQGMPTAGAGPPAIGVPADEWWLARGAGA
jgi:hypothetical protein